MRPHHRSGHSRLPIFIAVLRFTSCPCQFSHHSTVRSISSNLFKASSRSATTDMWRCFSKVPRIFVVVMLAVAAAVAAAAASLLGSVWAIDTFRLGMVARIATKLEGRFSDMEPPHGPAVTGIVVLGGNPSRARHAIALARRYPDAKIVLSGPGAEEIKALEAVPDVAQRLVIDRRPRTTFENALFSLEIARPGPGDQWLLVTSALHMPRSIGAFRSAGFPVRPAPVRDTPAVTSRAAGEMVRHETLGLIYYRLLGRSSALLPL